MANLVTFNPNASFNPFEQTFTILLPDGHSPSEAYMSDIFLVQHSAVSQAITQGTQIGASILLLIVLLLVTRKEKLTSLVFLLNALALVCVAIRGIITLCVITGPLYNFYRYELSWYGDMGDTQQVSAAGEVITCLLTMSIELSLILQVMIVCTTLEDWKRWAINTITVTGALCACAARFALMVLNIHWNILNVGRETQAQFDTITKVATAVNATLVISIAISAVVFAGKLGFAIRNRRSLGIKQFGAMQIIFVMGCQTMLTPFIFTLIVYCGVKHGQVTSYVPTVVAISLPLSAMWATVNTSHSQINTPHANNPGAIPVGNPNLDSDKSYDCKDSALLTSSTLVDDESPKMLSPRRGWSIGKSSSSSGRGQGEDVEMGRMTNGGGVQVDRTYTVLTE